MAIATLATVAMVAASCGTSDDASESATSDAAATESGDAVEASDDSSVDTLEVMSRWAAGSAEAEAFDAAAASFTEQTGVEIDVVGQAEEDLDVIYEAALLGGTEPHIVIVNLFDKSIAWLDNDATVDVSSYVDEWGIADQVDANALGEWTLEDGRVQGFPYSGFAWPIWYNTELLAEAGIDTVPTTVDELEVATAALREAGIGPVVVGGSDWSGQKLFMQIAQSYLEPSATQSLLESGGWCDSPEGLKGIELFADLLAAGVFVDDVEGFTADLMNESYYNGDSAIMPAGSWAFANTPEDVLAATQISGFPLPADGVFDAPTVYQGFTGVGFMVSPRGESEALPAIEQFIEYMYTEDVYGSFVQAANIVPAIQLTDTSVATDPLLQSALSSEYSEGTDVALLMDVHVPPASGDAVNQAIALAYNGADADEVCGLIDSGY
ncbi:MAG: extracellular solute-binding protein [Ilumatobacter sp.]|uniref:ABC transporter substrate-binding protein n=1 Tax=Ilumatobacter sp. TaxID=1967498 RepID=UPI003C72E9FE